MSAAPAPVRVRATRRVANQALSRCRLAQTVDERRDALAIADAAIAELARGVALLEAQAAELRLALDTDTSVMLAGDEP